MRASHVIRGAAVIATTLFAACSGDVAAPTAPPALKTDPGSTAPVVVPVLTRDLSLAHDVSASAVIGPKGGRLRLREAGLEVVVPRGAVPEPTTFTVTALAGDVVAYEFEPHGLRFAVPLEATQKLKGTNWWHGRGSAMELGYFTDRTLIDTAAHTATVEERYPTKLAVRAGPKLRFDIPHFSGYLISTARGKPN